MQKAWKGYFFLRWEGLQNCKAEHKLIQVEHEGQTSNQAKQADFNQASLRCKGEIVLSKLVCTEERN